ncbi:MAG: M16 family metallopeptidase [Terrimicrobiaceae bacterium]
MANKNRLTTLPGGLRVATCEMPHAETASMGIWASVGGRHEPAKLNGISHFIEHMLFKGTARRSARRIMEEIEGVGGDMNAFTAEERTCYYATAAAEHFPRVCDVLCDLYMNPRFSPRDIDRERGVIGEEILMYQDEPASLVEELLEGKFWEGHPLGRPITGTLQTIEAMDAEAFRSYRASHYNAASTVVTAAGKIEHDYVVDSIARLLDGLPGRKAPAAQPCPSPANSPRIVTAARDIQQTQLSMAFPGLSHCDNRRYAAILLHVVLGANATSRLFQELREKRGLCYSVSSHLLTLKDGGYLGVSAGLDRRNIEKSLSLVLAQCELLSKKNIPTAELRRAKEYSIGSSRMSLERASSQNMRLGGSILAHGEIIEPEVVNDRIRRVTADEIREVACQILDPSRITVAVVGPDPDSKMLHRLLAA